MITVPQDVCNFVVERTRPHLKDLPFHNYSLEWLVIAVYCQAIKDMMQLIQDQPNEVASITTIKQHKDANHVSPDISG